MAKKITKLTKNAAFYLGKCIWRPLVKDFMPNHHPPSDHYPRALMYFHQLICSPIAQPCRSFSFLLFFSSSQLPYHLVLCAVFVSRLSTRSCILCYKVLTFFLNIFHVRFSSRDLTSQVISLLDNGTKSSIHLGRQKWRDNKKVENRKSFRPQAKLTDE